MKAHLVETIRLGFLICILCGSITQGHPDTNQRADQSDMPEWVFEQSGHDVNLRADEVTVVKLQGCSGAQIFPYKRGAIVSTIEHRTSVSASCYPVTIYSYSLESGDLDVLVDDGLDHKILDFDESQQALTILEAPCDYDRTLSSEGALRTLREFDVRSKQSRLLAQLDRDDGPLIAWDASRNNLYLYGRPANSPESLYRWRRESGDLKQILPDGSIVLRIFSLPDGSILFWGARRRGDTRELGVFVIRQDEDEATNFHPGVVELRDFKVRGDLVEYSYRMRKDHGDRERFSAKISEIESAGAQLASSLDDQLDRSLASELSTPATEAAITRNGKELILSPGKEGGSVLSISPTDRRSDSRPILKLQDRAHFAARDLDTPFVIVLTNPEARRLRTSETPISRAHEIWVIEPREESSKCIGKLDGAVPDFVWDPRKQVLYVCSSTLLSWSPGSESLEEVLSGRAAVWEVLPLLSGGLVIRMGYWIAPDGHARDAGVYYLSPDRDELILIDPDPQKGNLRIDPDSPHRIKFDLLVPPSRGLEATGTIQIPD
ncbi:hypothetical protein KQI84_08595 [bacterium]|nr:hypothetical protein [bacterium]